MTSVHTGLRAVEFYSGIGGMHSALKVACPSAVVVAALEISENANEVYAANYCLKPSQVGIRMEHPCAMEGGSLPRVAASLLCLQGNTHPAPTPAGSKGNRTETFVTTQVNIEALTPKQLDKYGADLWLLAPPCQPFTRQGLKKDATDGRARSFLHLLDALPALSRPPRYVLLENVVGFETSLTRGAMAAALAAQGYSLQEFILTPLQLGIPYSRPRYFALAKKQPLRFLMQPSVHSAAPSAAHHSDGGISDGSGSSGSGCSSAAQPSPAGAEVRDASDASRLQPPPQHIFVQPPSQLLAQAAGDVQRAAPPPVCPIRDFLIDDPSSEAVQASTSNKRPRRGDSSGGGRAGTARAETVAAAAEAGAGLLSVAEQTQLPAAAASRTDPCSAGSSPWEPFWVPDKVIAQSADVIDVVAPQSSRCCCFTKSYGSYNKGTGSLLATAYDAAAHDQWRLVDGSGSLVLREGYELVACGGPSRQQLPCPPPGGRDDDDVGGEDVRPSASGLVVACGGEECGQQQQEERQRQEEQRQQQQRQEEEKREALEPEVAACQPGGCVTCCLPGGGAGGRDGGDSAAAAAAAAAGEAAASAAEAAGRRVQRDLAREGIAHEWRQLGRLRYFTPKEVANLHSFPPAFAFPPHVPLRQRYALLGNSLSVAVVADLLAYLLAD